ncbi:alpha/beta fold hydrolase [Streptomyces sp. NPDC048417]|uniref:thioesterase II family protein n=1 Tax=Streptomyces sp. NPDC048417 TaxID=3155387 RepID=UPI00342A3129
MTRRPRLLCFPHAGASGSVFAGWPAALGDHTEVVPVALPGRGAREARTRISGLGPLLAHLMELTEPLRTGPYVLYGHSLGGLIAHALAAELRRLGLPRPGLVMVGAAVPPHLTAPLRGCAELPDADLLDLLVAYGTMPERALRWPQRVLPALRDDLRLAEALAAASVGAVVDAPLLAVAGSGDAVAPPAVMAEWARCAGSSFRLARVPGGHLFADRPPVLRLVRAALAAAGARPGRLSVRPAGAAVPTEA